MDIRTMQRFLTDNGFLFPTAEIYGGLAGFFDYGPNGVEVKRAVRDLWWKSWVTGQEGVVGIDGCIITLAAR